MPDLKKCPRGHFYDSDLFSVCPYCPSESVRSDSAPDDQDKTVPVWNEPQTGFVDVKKDMSAQDVLSPDFESTDRERNGSQTGGWCRLLCIAAALVMLIYAVVTLLDGSRNLSQAHNMSWHFSSEIERQSAIYELITSAASIILFVCIVIAVKTKGKKPPFVVPAIAAAAAEVTIYLHANCYKTFFREMYRYGYFAISVFGNMTQYTVWVMLIFHIPPLLSFLALYLYWREQKKSA